MSAGYAAVVRRYPAWVSGLILIVVTRRGGDAAAERFAPDARRRRSIGDLERALARLPHRP
jgi:hypothetical protein